MIETKSIGTGNGNMDLGNQLDMPRCSPLEGFVMMIHAEQAALIRRISDLEAQVHTLQDTVDRSVVIDDGSVYCTNLPHACSRGFYITFDHTQLLERQEVLEMTRRHIPDIQKAALVIIEEEPEPDEEEGVVYEYHILGLCEMYRNTRQYMKAAQAMQDEVGLDKLVLYDNNKDKYSIQVYVDAHSLFYYIALGMTCICREWEVPIGDHFWYTYGDGHWEAPHVNINDEHHAYQQALCKCAYKALKPHPVMSQLTYSLWREFE